MSHKITNLDVFKLIEAWAPQSFAYEWDNVGLQVGTYSSEVKKIMVTLDVLDSVVDEAIEKDVDLIVAHHPLLFKPMSQINLDTYQGRLIQKLISNNISVYAAHTNLDIAEGGVNDLLFDALPLHTKEVLVEAFHEKLFKIVVYVPVSHMDKVSDALSQAGAGHIGNYSHCAFRTEGKGTFKPLEGTNPYIGSQDKIEQVDEVKIETIVPQSVLPRAKSEMIEAHPYEEPAYDIYAMENKGKTFGLGRLGQLDTQLTLKELSEQIKEVYDLSHVRVTGDLNKTVERVAILGGSGEKYFKIAKQKGADVYITGDMTFHAAQDAEKMELAIIDPGHHVEKVMKQGVKNYLQDKLDDKNIDVIVSELSTDPFKAL